MYRTVAGAKARLSLVRRRESGLGALVGKQRFGVLVPGPTPVTNARDKRRARAVETQVISISNIASLST
ncbi:unnamed protein product [Closterium sp. Yama58-4]|nr:unnamed protein product [Closterium sp. Yama58-4]